MTYLPVAARACLSPAATSATFSLRDYSNKRKLYFSCFLHLVPLKAKYTKQTEVEHYENSSHNSSLHVTMHTNTLYHKGSKFWPTKISGNALKKKKSSKATGCTALWQ